MEEILLKPCPYCAGKARMIAVAPGEDGGKWMTFVSCVSCGVSSKGVRSDDRDSAIEMSKEQWNTRV
jgi:hypothetical protein